MWKIAFILIVLLAGSYGLPADFFLYHSSIWPIIDWISLSGSRYGLIGIGLIFYGLLKPPNQSCFLGLILVIGIISWCNENILKPYIAQPRPNIVWLEQTGRLYTDSFYDLDRKQRSAYLAASLKTIDLPPRIKQHWQNEVGFSWPSGHTLAAVMLAFFFSLWAFELKKNRLIWLFYAWAMVVAYSRILIGVHRPIDLISAGLLGLFIIGIYYSICRGKK